MDETLKPVLERQMEIYAGFLEHTDFHIGRIIDTLETIGALDNTLIYYIIGDNGASAEGTVHGRVQRDGQLQRAWPRSRPRSSWPRSRTSSARSMPTTTIGRLGVGDVHPLPVDQAGRLALGWHPERHHRALAGRDHRHRHPVPVLPRDRRGTNHSRGRRATGAGLRQRRPAVADRGHQHGLHFDDPEAPERHDLQYFEMVGNRGIYFKGWSAVTRHSTPWLPTEVLPALDDDVWELYDGNNDWSQSRDLAAEQPDRLAKLQRLWLIEAVKYNVLPIDDRRFERLNATIAGRPQLITGTTQVLFPGMKRLSEGSVIDIKNRSFSVTASIDTPADGPTNGVIIAQGGRFGGWALFVKQGRATFVYNLLGMQEFVIEATEELTAGQPSGPGRVRL